MADPISVYLVFTCVRCLPEHVVDGDDVLLVDVLGVTDDRGTGLHPDIAAMAVHQTIVVGEYLTLVQHCDATATRSNVFVSKNTLCKTVVTCKIKLN